MKTDREVVLVTLYVVGLGPRCTQALQLVRRLCDEHLADAYELAVVDLQQRPAETATERIAVVPTLRRDGAEGPEKRLTDVSDPAKVLRFLTEDDDE